MHTNLPLDTARAFEAEVRRRVSRPDRMMAHELQRDRRSRRGRRSR
jgi:hypothetical protein